MIIPAFISDLLVDQGIKLAKKVIPEVIKSIKGDNPATIIAYRKIEGNNNVLLFVHGFSGNAKDTYGATPQLLIEDPNLDGWDIYSIGYSSDIMPTIGTDIWSTKPNISKIAQYLETLVTTIFDKYDRIAFTAHSMGGLVVQRCILHLDEEYFNKISHCFFFGTPSNGLSKASFFSFWNKQIHDMDAKGEFIKTLRQEWNQKFNQEYPFVFKSFAGSTDDFVPTSSSHEPFDEKYREVIEGNHINMVKPKDESDKQSQIYLVLVTLLAAKKSEILNGSSLDLNIIYGKYHDTINRLTDHVNDIDARGLKDLVLAYEGIGQSKKALEILLNHPLSQTHSDIMGLIGGRYKRLYLLGSKQSDADAAKKHYQAGLTKATNDSNKEQIFYHAINLAFLSLVNEQNKSKMKEYAQLALDNCDLKSVNVFEIATIAEASLYLGDMVQADTYYKLVKSRCHDIRIISSIYLNAYRTVEALNEE